VGATAKVRVHGADRILSVEGQARRLHDALPESQPVEIEGGPQVMCVTHTSEVNEALFAFLKQPVPTGANA
jgi:non-heme chloroperoxidase